MTPWYLRIWTRVKTATVSTEGSPVAVYTLAAINLLLFGVGTFGLGVMNNSGDDMVIGILQLCLPVVGWLWSIAWAAVIVYRKLDEA